MLCNDPFPAISVMGKHVRVLICEEADSIKWMETCKIMSAAVRGHGIYVWSRAHFNEREDTSDPLSKQGTKELYWRSRNAHELTAVKEFDFQSRTQLAQFRKEAEKRDAQLSGAENRNISNVLRPSSLFRPTVPVGDVTDENVPSPPKLVSFDSATILDSGARMTTVLSFHPYEPLLASGDGEDGISLWAYEQGERCWQLRNGNARGSRLTSLDWVNEDGPCRLAVGSDDGNIRLWGGLGGFNKGPRLVSCINAVPDIHPGWDGSGLVSTYSHPIGHLYAGGQSPFLRLWDVKSERCVAKWTADTQNGSCVTALAVPNVQKNTTLSILDGPVVLSGFGDGTLRLFDARISNDRNAVSSWYEHLGWVVGVHLSGEYEVISASVQGDVNIHDLRNSGVVRTLDPLADRSATLTAFTVHPHAPIIGVGTHAKFIKVSSFSILFAVIILLLFGCLLLEVVVLFFFI
jgi:WD40 repeat protein